LSVFEIVGAGLGLLFIAVVGWKVITGGIAPSDGKVNDVNSFDQSQGATDQLMSVFHPLQTS
jgi:hypothetical protein